MKRYLYILFIFFLIIVINGCNKSDVVTIQLENYQENLYFYNEFNIEDYKLLIYKQNGDIEYVNVSSEMFKESDYDLLKTPGYHEIVLEYLGKEIVISFTIINNKETYQFEIYKESLDHKYVYDQTLTVEIFGEFSFESLFSDEKFLFNGFTLSEEYQYIEEEIKLYKLYYDRNKYNLYIYDNETLLHCESFYYQEKIDFTYIPLKENFIFDGYDSTIPLMMEGDLTLTAIFKPLEYSYTFLDYDGSVIKNTISQKNSIIELPENPTRESDYMYNYTFKCWEGYEIGMKLTENMVFNAVYDKSLNKYNVIYKNVDGQILETQIIEYGGSSIYKGATPVHPYSEEYDFYFLGWNKEVNYITQDIEVYAVFDAVKTKFLVNVEIDGNVNINYVEYGSDLILPDNPQKRGHTFIGWTHDGNNITSTMTISALFEINSYDVSYYIDGVKYRTVSHSYGDAIENVKTDNDENNIFTGWNCEYDTVPDCDIAVYGHFLNISEFNKQYDGKKKEITFSKELKNVKINYYNNDNYITDVIDAGNYSLEFIYTEINGKDYKFDYSFTIAKADSVISAENLTVTYDGNIHYLDYTLNHNESVVVSDCTGFINAGTYCVRLSVSESKNYNSCEVVKVFTIEKAVYDLNGIVFDDLEYTYDGQEKIAEIKGILPKGLSVSYTNNTLVDAGKTIAIASFDGDYDNYEVVNDITCTLVIKPKKASIIINNTSSVYGEKLEKFTYTYEGFIKSINVEIIKEDGLNVGLYRLYTLYNDDNYLIDITEGLYEITKATYNLSDISFDNKKFVYDGTIKVIEIEGTLPNGVTASYSNNTIIDVGSINPVVTFDGDYDNYEVIPNMDCMVYVEPKNVTITIDNISSVYGEELMPYTYKDNGLCARDNVEIIISKEEGLDVGEYALTGDASHGNYIFTFVNAVYRIVYADFIGLEFNNKTVVYNGDIQSIEVEGLTDELSVTYSNNYMINAGTYEVVATISSANYNEVVLKAILTIERKEAVIKIDSKESKYGAELLPFTFTSEGFIEEINPVILKEDGLNAGTYTLTTNYSNNNYNIRVIDGDYRILKADSVISINSDNNIFTYTGDPIVLTASLNHNECQLAYTNNGNIDVGLYSMIIECKETTNYNSAKITFAYAIKYVVNFYDSLGNVIFADYVLSGENAQYIGANPMKDSDFEYYYVFENWDKSYLNVTSNLDIYPIYNNYDVMYNIIYKDFNESIVKEYKNVLYNDLIEEPGKVIRTSTTSSKAYIFNMWEVLIYENSIDNKDGTRSLTLYPIYNEVVAAAKIDKVYFGDIIDAIVFASAGDVITVLKTTDGNLDITEDCVLKEDVTLYIPYADGIELANANGDKRISEFDISNRYIQLTITNSRFNVNGKIVIGAETGFTTYQGHSSVQGSLNGAFSEIVLNDNGHIIIGDGDNNAEVICYGRIIDNSTTVNQASITVKENASLMENFVIYDWKGGNYLATNFAFNPMVFPFNRYQLPYVSVLTKFEYGSKYKGIGKVYASLSEGTPEFVSMPFMIIGEELDSNTSYVNKGLFTISDNNSSIVKKFDDTNDVAVNSYTDNLTINLYGNVKINALSFYYNNTPYSTNKVYFPIPYGMSLNLVSCNLEINNLFKLMPGGVVNIDENSIVSLNSIYKDEEIYAGLVIYDSYNYNSAPDYYYPTKEQLLAVGKASSGVVINDGKIIVDSSDVSIGGSIIGKGKLIKNYPTNNGFKGEIPSIDGSSYVSSTYLSLYYNDEYILRGDTGIYE